MDSNETPNEVLHSVQDRVEWTAMLLSMPAGMTPADDDDRPL